MTAKQGLYDPAYEHDACGIGFVANIHGARSRDIVEKSLQLLVNLSHRSAVAADSCTGDGAGVLRLDEAIAEDDEHVACNEIRAPTLILG